MAHVSFIIKDGEESLSLKNLIDEFINPAMIAIARFVDQILLGRVYGFLSNVYGNLGGLTNSTSIDYITGVRNIMNQNKAHMEDRNLILTPNAETSFLRTASFTEADKIGDNGTALREASLGRKFGYNIWMAQNTPSVASANTTVTGAINNVGGYAAGTTTVTVDGLSAAITNGTWFRIAGDGQPLRVISTVGGAIPTSITFSPALKGAVADDAVVSLYTPGAVNEAAGYAEGYAKEITVDGFTVSPQVGQMVSFGTASDVYSIISVNGLVGITLDRPLVAAVADDAKVNLGPPGDFNFAFHRNALALVVRPFRPPEAGLARSATVNVDGLSIRATLTYNGEKQGTLVTLDMLCGTAILEPLLGAVMLG